MKKQFCYTVLFFLLFLTGREAFATHIVGGELNYKHLGGNNYEIRLTVYRDCYVGVPPFDNPAFVGIFDSNNSLLQTLQMPFRGLDTLPPAINDPCMIPPLDFCYEVTTYIDTVNLPPRAGGYQISYQRCCRNQNILNIINPECVGATYYATIPGPEVVAINSNPVFKLWPPPFICVNKPWVFDQSATDADGDSLVYELFMPYDGLTAACPVVTNPTPFPAGSTCPNSVTSCPPVPVSPPFPSIVWKTPYSTANMLGGVPMQINSSTGQVTATPNLQGYFVIGIKVKEYRNGVFLSETKRDFQLIVKACPQVVVAAAQVPQAICETTNVSFTNNSSGSSGLSFNWYFGDPTTLADTSHAISPSYNYPGTGSYSVTMVAYVSSKPACNDTVNTVVSISESFKASFTFTAIPCSENLVAFTAIAENPPERPLPGSGTSEMATLLRYKIRIITILHQEISRSPSLPLFPIPLTVPILFPHKPFMWSPIRRSMCRTPLHPTTTAITTFSKYVAPIFRYFISRYTTAGDSCCLKPPMRMRGGTEPIKAKPPILVYLAIISGPGVMKTVRKSSKKEM